jgi:magnesium chelatase subunit I
MNPEEGDIRPQLLDRFGLVVKVVGEQVLSDRVKVIKRRLAYEEDPQAFCECFQRQQAQLAQDMRRAKKLLSRVTIGDEFVELAARIALKVGVDGHRADITMVKAAKTLAAYRQREHVTRLDILEAAELVLPHRLRRQPFEEEAFDLSLLSQWVAENDG